MERPDRGRDRTVVNPEPARPDLFEFVEKLFEGNDQKPERLELRQAYGPGARKYGTTISHKEYRANAAKPTREQMVSLSNEFLALAQQNCNELGKAHKYAILAKHYNKSDTYYAAFLISMRPKQRPGDHEDDLEEDDMSSDARRRDALLQYSLDHLKEGNENRRWEQDQFSTAIGHLFERYEHIIEKSFGRIEQLEGRYLEFFKATEEALSKKHERDLAAEMQKFKVTMMQDGFQFLKQMAPVAVNQLTGKKTIPTEDSAESIAIQNFLKGLSETQGVSLFGDFQDGRPAGGVFTPTQAAIFFSVANNQQPPEILDRLLDGPDAVGEQQLMKAQTVISAQQFMPLLALVMERKKKQMEKAS